MDHAATPLPVTTTVPTPSTPFPVYCASPGLRLRRIACPARSGIAPPVFSLQRRRIDVVAAYPELNSTCEHLHIGWNAPIGQFCEQPEQALLELARAAKPPPPPASIIPAGRTTQDLVQDIVQHHHRPLRNELERCSILIEQLCADNPGQVPTDLRDQFSHFSDSVIAHLDQEELVVFPLSIIVERDHLRENYGPPVEQDVLQAITLNLGHDSATSSLHYLLNQMSRLPFFGVDADAVAIVVALMAMLADLPLHEEKERGILNPAIRFAERTLSERDLAGKARDRA